MRAKILRTLIVMKYRSSPSALSSTACKRGRKRSGRMLNSTEGLGQCCGRDRRRRAKDLQLVLAGTWPKVAAGRWKLRCGQTNQVKVERMRMFYLWRTTIILLLCAGIA